MVHDIVLIIHFIGLVMGIGTGFGFLFLGLAKAKMEEKEGIDFQIKSLALGGMGRIGLVLLILSGGYLMSPYWKSITTEPLLMAKMALVVLMIGLIGMIEATSKKAKQPGGESHLAKLETFGKITLPTGVAIIVCAVLFFH
ncbi:MAG: hypothetical protein HRT71_03735 [Flavobacteriales bacterium]|nr:hypothetical protein [Flavobacteriales bacterium]